MNKNQFLVEIRKRAIFLLKDKIVLILGSILFVALIYSSIIYNSHLKNKRTKSISEFLENNQTILLKNYILNQIRSPYLEYDYVVKNNDSIDSILKKFSIKSEEISLIVKKVKKLGLSNIVPGQKVSFILINLLYYIL